MTVTPATLTVVNTSAADKIYDRGTVAQLSGASLVGVLGSDVVSLDGATTTTGTFSSKNVGSRTVTTDMKVTGADATNYLVQQPVGLSATITVKSITPNVTASNRQYDGTTNATTTINGSGGVIAGDTVTFTRTSSQFDDKNVGTGRTVTVMGIGKGGADAGNYVLASTSATTTANITPRVLNLTGSRVYDATTSAGANTLTLGNLVAGEALTLGGAATLASKNVGMYSTGQLQTGGLSLADAGSSLASNYTLTGGTQSYRITAAPLTVFRYAGER